jgi:putative oxidoreductase
MKKIFFSADPLWANQILGLTRIVVGLFMVYHGWEVFDKAKMAEYATWDAFKTLPSPTFMVYLGKGAELVGGILLTIGFLTRIACIILAGTMLYLAFFVGNGAVWYGDQHPFLFVLLALIFFFVGPGSFSVDKNNPEYKK